MENKMSQAIAKKNISTSGAAAAVSLSSDAQKLAQFIKTLCLVRAEAITLSSGKQSQVYFNMKRLAADPQAMRLAAKLLGARIIKHSDVNYIGGLELGAVPLIASVITQSQHLLCGFYIRKITKGHGLKKLIEGLKDESELKGQKVIILEDVTTTGRSSLEAVKAVREEGAQVKEVITLLDRQEGAAENLKKENIPLTAILRASDILYSAA